LPSIKGISVFGFLVNSSISKPSTFSNTRRTQGGKIADKHFVLNKSIACLHRFCFHRWVLISFPCIHTLQADSKQVTLSQTLIHKALISAIKTHVPYIHAAVVTGLDP
jgi:hypothetical protein